MVSYQYNVLVDMSLGVEYRVFWWIKQPGLHVKIVPRVTVSLFSAHLSVGQSSSYCLYFSNHTFTVILYLFGYTRPQDLRFEP